MSNIIKATYKNHVARMQQLHLHSMQKAQVEFLVIGSGRAQFHFLDDQHYPVKTNPLFKAWLPLLRHVDCYLIIAPNTKPKLLYFQEQDFWHKPAADPDEFWANELDIVLYADKKMPTQMINKIEGRWAYLGEEHSIPVGCTPDAINPKAVIDFLHFHRCVKTDYEIRSMEQAQTIAVQGHHAAESAFRQGASEFETNIAYIRAVQQSETELPYNNIIAFNESAATLHYQHLSRADGKEMPSHSFLIDAGAECNGYASDITRTYSYSDDSFANLISLMHAKQQQICAQVLTGTNYADIHAYSHEKIAEFLQDSELVSGSVESMTHSDITRTFYPHGIGHPLGLQVHDVGGFLIGEDGETKNAPARDPFLRMTRDLQPGMVVTIEPGVYFIEFLLHKLRATPSGDQINWPLVDSLKKFGGIRVEDNVLVTGEAPRNLTREAFASR